MFNAFKYTKQLEEAGFSREQAEIQLQVITEIVEGELATKQDLKILETSMTQEMKGLETRLTQDMKTLGTSLRQEMQNLETRLLSANQILEYRITIKLGALLVVGFTTMATLMKFWIIH